MKPTDLGDSRRALALLRHGIGNDDDGLEVIINEADQAGRLDELIVAQVEIFWQFADQLRSPTEVAKLEQMLTLAATADGVHPDNRLAARPAVAHRRGDDATVAEVLALAGEDHDGRVLLALSVGGAVVVMLSELRTPEGLWVLNEFAMKIAADEAGH